MAGRRPGPLAVVAALACLLVPAAVILVASGVSDDRHGRTVVGILVGVAGLVCLRVLYWARRVRAMTQAGLALHGKDDQRDERGHPRA